MKNILFSLLILATLGATAQSTLPRTGNTPNVDNTYRVLQATYASYTQDAAGLDTIKLNPYAFHTTVNIASVLDSVAINVVTNVSSFQGDELELYITNSSTGKAIKWAGSYIQTATTTTDGGVGAIVLTASKKAHILFKFDGATWVEVCRMVQ